MSKKNGRILIVDDDTDVLTAASLLLKQHFNEVITERNPEQIPQHLASDQIDVIVLDMNFKSTVNTGNEGFFWLQRILKADPSAVVVMFTAYGDVEMAVRAVKEGAVDFVLKPWHNEKFLSTLTAAMKLSEARKKIDVLKSKQRRLQSDSDQPYREIIGRSRAMLDVFATIDKVAATDANVLILGENGTGKDLIARAIHKKSLRADDVFIAVDLGSIAESLFESEMFGHKKGAFTDARDDRKGRFEVADGGTIFLDEIGNLNLPQQAKLLSVLQNREITPVGANAPVAVDFRLICATNVALGSLVEKKQFRQDLYYRIKTVEIYLPPLRDRAEDIPPLAEHFMRHFARKYQKPLAGIHPKTMDRLMNHHWPGNIRELQHFIERAVILCDGPELITDGLDAYADKDAALNGVPTTFNLDELEKLTIRKVLDRHKGNISSASKELGLTRASLYRRMEKYGL